MVAPFFPTQPHASADGSLILLAQKLDLELPIDHLDLLSFDPMYYTVNEDCLRGALAPAESRLLTSCRKGGTLSYMEPLRIFPDVSVISDISCSLSLELTSPTHRTTLSFHHPDP